MIITYMGAPVQAKEIGPGKARKLIANANPHWSDSEVTAAVSAPYALMDLGHGRILHHQYGVYAVAYTGK